MIISKSKKFIFIHLEKCGGTSIEIALEPYLAWDDMILGSTEFGITLQVAQEIRKQKYGATHDILWKHSTAQQIKEYLGEEYYGFYKFATVREPIELMTSLYFYSKKIVEGFLNSENVTDLYEWSVLSMPKGWKDEVYLLNYLISELDGTKIDGFIERMLRSNHQSSVPQSLRIDDSVELFDISNINEKWSYILNNLKITEKIKINKENSSQRNPNIIMSDRIKDMIKYHFKQDYEIIPERTGVSWNG